MSDSGEARRVLQKAAAYHREAKDMSLRFRAEVYNAASDKHESYQGKLLLGDSDRFRLEIPAGIYVSDGSEYWEYHPQNHQALLRNARNLEEGASPGGIFLRFLDADPVSMERVKLEGREYWKLRLNPSVALKNLDSLSVWLNPSDCSVFRIDSRDLSGNETDYTLRSVKRNTGLKDEEFRYAPPKGAEVVDMRE